MLKIVLFTFIVVQWLLHESAASKPHELPVCTSIDDPHMKTFDGTPYEFHHDGAHFILYTDKRDTRITAGYQKCGYNAARCNCAIYVKKGDKVAFIDFCGVKDPKSPLDRFYTVSKTANDAYGPEAIKQLPCKPILPNQLPHSGSEGEGIWSTIIPVNQVFKCVQIGDGTYRTYVVRAHDPKTPGDTVSVRVDVGSLSMPRVAVTPGVNSFENTGGLCGMWNNNRDRDLYILDDNGNEQYGVNDLLLKNFWSLDTTWKPFINGRRESSAERCPECFIKAERRLYCPCDEFSLTQEMNNNNSIVRENFCATPMPNCVEKSLDFPTSPITPLYTTTAAPVTGVTGVTGVSTTTSPGMTPEQAFELCSNAILNNPGLKPLILAGVFDPTDAINNCHLDLVLTNDLGFIQIHIDLSLIQALFNVLMDVTYYQNGTYTEAGLDLLIHLCPGGCGGNGQCVINQACVNVNTITAGQVLECITPVMCECKENFGGPDCLTDTLVPPDFFLIQRCCDVRNYDCSKLSGYGYPVARRTKLYYRVSYSETDNVISFDGTTTGLATVVSDNEFTIDLPLNEYWRQNKSFVDVNIGISYNLQRFKYSKLQLFDSKCRYCDDETGQVSNEAIKDATCLIENACYVDTENEPGNEDNICDVNTNPFEWTYIGYTSPFCDPQTHAWSQWYNIDDPSGDGDIEIVALKQELKCNASELEVFTVDDLPAEKTNQKYYLGLAYGFICLNKDQVDGKCLDYKIRQCCAL